MLLNFIFIALLYTIIIYIIHNITQKFISRISVVESFQVIFNGNERYTLLKIPSPVWVMILIEFIVVLNLFLVYQYSTIFFVISTIVVNSYLLLYFTVYVWILPSQYKIFLEPQEKFKKNFEEIHKRNFDIIFKSHNTSFYCLLFLKLSDNKTTKNDSIFDILSSKNTEKQMIDYYQTMLTYTLSNEKKQNYLVSSCILLITVLNYAALLLFSLEKEILVINNLSTTSSFIDCLYFIVVTISTLGYGDMYPISPLAKILVVSVMFILLFVLNSVIALSETIIQSKYSKFANRFTEYSQGRLNSLNQIEALIYYNQLETSESKETLKEIAKHNIIDESSLKVALNNIDKIKNKI